MSYNSAKRGAANRRGRFPNVAALGAGYQQSATARRPQVQEFRKIDAAHLRRGIRFLDSLELGKDLRDSLSMEESVSC
jgi:hypothetical protein